MGNPAATVGSLAAHGGVIIQGSPNVLIGGLPAARMGDKLTCPLHGPGTIIMGAATVLANGKPMARLGDACICKLPGTILLGNPTVLIGGAVAQAAPPPKPAAPAVGNGAASPARALTPGSPGSPDSLAPGRPAGEQYGPPAPAGHAMNPAPAAQPAISIPPSPPGEQPCSPVDAPANPLAVPSPAASSGESKPIAIPSFGISSNPASDPYSPFPPGQNGLFSPSEQPLPALPEPEQYGPTSPPDTPNTYARSLTAGEAGTHSIDWNERYSKGGATVAYVEATGNSGVVDGELRNSGEARVGMAHLGTNRETLGGQPVVVNNKGSVDFGYAEVKGTTADSRWGSGFTLHGEAGMVRAQDTVTVTTAPLGEDNPTATGKTGGVSHIVAAQGDVSAMIGRADGKIGFTARASVEGMVADLKGSSTTTASFLGINVELNRVSGGFTGPSAKIGAGAWAYYDEKTSRINLGIMGKFKALIGIDEDVNVSIGLVGKNTAKVGKTDYLAPK